MMDLSDVVFLSHLCGEEVYTLDNTPTLRFLSHLCGEEVSDSTASKTSLFLSHLSGDEAIIPDCHAL